MISRTRAAGSFVLLIMATSLSLGIQAAESKPVVKGKGLAPLETDRQASARPWLRYGGWPGADYSEFNTLAHLVSPAIGTPPTMDFSKKGDAEKGKKLAFDRSRGGSCVACHVMGSDTPTMPGNVGPDLSIIGGQRSDDQLFKQIYDARLVNKATVMPPWGTHKVFTPEEILDMVAFLQTLKSPAKLKDDLEDPNKRPMPVEDRDNLDVFTNPSILAWEKGRDLFVKPGPNGKACNGCHAAPEKSFKTWAATMPKWETRMGKVLGVEEFITRHGRATTEIDYLMQSDENLAMSIYLKRIANGQPIKVNTKTPGAKEAADRGRILMTRKVGQLNFACNDCHQIGANKWIRGQWLGEFKGQIDHFPTWRTSQSLIWDIRKRFQWCGVAIRANEMPPEAIEYGELELYLTSLNNGFKMNVPGIRH